ncbi:hypothetical protein V494_02361 [Pseudogymnoascus sp. VKM F-4513 (FW-928)]|nr:hypothetical protein V494_02361 [Pseudogymnoascus sp. VKM F-4513 (FW-928)]
MHNDAYNASNLCTIAVSRTESKEPLKLHLPNTNQSANLLLLTASIVMSSRRRSPRRPRRPRRVDQVAPSPVAKPRKKRQNPTTSPQKTMRTRSTSRAVQGHPIPNPAFHRRRAPSSAPLYPSITPRKKEILQGGGSARQIFERASAAKPTIDEGEQKPVPSAIARAQNGCRGTFGRRVGVLSHVSIEVPILRPIHGNYERERRTEVS